MRKTRAHTTVRKTSILIKRRKTLNRGMRRRIAQMILTMRISRRMRITKSIKTKVTQESITSSNLTAKIMKTKTNLKTLIIARSS